MKAVKVTQYVADDGTVFEDEDSCLKHENLIKRLEPIKRLLDVGFDVEDINFANGSGYCQHDRDNFEKAKTMLLEIALESFTESSTGPYEWIKTTLEKSWDDSSIHPSWAARAIDDGCPSLVRKMFYRFYCTDESYREWGQPYFAANPGKGTQKKLN